MMVPFLWRQVTATYNIPSLLSLNVTKKHRYARAAQLMDVAGEALRLQSSTTQRTLPPEQVRASITRSTQPCIELNVAPHITTYFCIFVSEQVKKWAVTR